jgi:hypothetical protein
MPQTLADGDGFTDFTFLELDKQGLFIDGGRQIPAPDTVQFLSGRLRIDASVTDVIVWVHGWRNDREMAARNAARLFRGIQKVYADRPGRYPALSGFKPGYVAVHWPSQSLPFYCGYRKIRDRAHVMTTDGTAEFPFAALLGYLDMQRPSTGPRVPGLLRAKEGYYVHCVGHSFGGRFLSEAIAHAASPRLPILGLRPRPGRFAYTVDTLLVFQMAAPPDIFAKRLSVLLEDAPVSGPVCLTFSSADRANCHWHQKAEGVCAIGCKGATEPSDQIQTIRMRPIGEDYRRDELTSPLVNIDAGWIFNRSALLAPQGAHSDFWYEESVHLLLTLAHWAR